jgi:DNA-binding transcriptional regulator YdaS (Cro superfamily)
MQLQSYLKETGQSQDEFGQKLVPKASQGLISQWIRGKTRITLDYALQIATASSGAVTPQDCADMFLAAEPDKVLS